MLPRQLRPLDRRTVLSYLALDVHTSMRRLLGCLEDRQCLCGSEEDLRTLSLDAFLEGAVSTMVKSKLNHLGIGIESQLLGQKLDVQGRLIPALVSTVGRGRVDLRFAHLRQGREALPCDKHVHQVGAHVGHIKIQPEEAMVVPRRERRSHL